MVKKADNILRGVLLEMQIMSELEQQAAKEQYRITAYEKLIVKYEDNPQAINYIYALMDAEGGM